MANSFPSGENATAITASDFVSIVYTTSPLFIFQTTHRPSDAPEATLWPSGENAGQRIAFV
jgi:hypothetical protein